MTTVYYIPKDRDRYHVHTHRDCHCLRAADRVAEADHRDVSDRDMCHYCEQRDTPDFEGIPRAVECPCGMGKATRTKIPTSDPNDQHGRPVRFYHYRHGPCQMGGTIVMVGDAVRRRYGPVFEPERYAPAGFGVSAGD